MEQARQPLFAKKPELAGNSNNAMEKWKKKEKGGGMDKETEKAMVML